jgi:hypothetical protein
MLGKLRQSSTPSALFSESAYLINPLRKESLLFA